jgi:hypothetical protein
VEPATQGGCPRLPPVRTMSAMKITTRKRRRAFIESYEFPPALRTKLREKLDGEHQVAVALEGLRHWYLACLHAGRETLGMPSRAVDIAWHEMILMTRTYHAFCERAFGHYLHHTPDSLMRESMDDSLARTYAAAPLLFAVDAELGLADGYRWEERDLRQLRAAPTVYRGYYGPHGGGCGAGSGDGGGGGGGGCGGGGCGGGG